MHTQINAITPEDHFKHKRETYRPSLRILFHLSFLTIAEIPNLFDVFPRLQV